MRAVGTVHDWGSGVRVSGSVSGLGYRVECDGVGVPRGVHSPSPSPSPSHSHGFLWHRAGCRVSSFRMEDTWLSVVEVGVPAVPAVPGSAGEFRAHARQMKVVQSLSPPTEPRVTLLEPHSRHLTSTCVDHGSELTCPPCIFFSSYSQA